MTAACPVRRKGSHYRRGQEKRNAAGREAEPQVPQNERENIVHLPNNAVSIEAHDRPLCATAASTALYKVHSGYGLQITMDNIMKYMDFFVIRVLLGFH